MQQKILEVQNYFIGKIVNLEFKIKETNDFQCEIIIDERYKFMIWIGNGFTSLGMGSLSSSHFMDLEKTFSQEEKRKIWGFIRPTIKTAKERALLAKREQYEKLKKELGEA